MFSRLDSNRNIDNLICRNLVDGAVVDFLSELRDQRASTGTLLTKGMDYEYIDKAYKRIKRNNGSPGVDGMQIVDAGKWLSKNVDELDKELERRGHKFCRYADDCNIRPPDLEQTEMS